MHKQVIIYTDGSCLGNPGAGGWAATLIYGGKRRELWGGEPDTTNNRMELTGAIKALEQLKESCLVELYTDSQYVMNAFAKKWLYGWQKNGWKTSGNKPVKNQDLWERLAELNTRHSITWRHVRGHQGQAENERCDSLARQAAQQAGETGEFSCLGEYSGEC